MRNGTSDSRILGSTPLEPTQNALYAEFNDTAPVIPNSTLDELRESRDRLRTQKGTNGLTQEGGNWILSPEDFLQTAGFVALATKLTALSPGNAQDFQTVITSICAAPGHRVPSSQADQHCPHLGED